MRLENGRSDRFWSDNWAPLGLVSALRDSPNSRLGIPLNAAIASLFRDDHWNLPAVRSEEMLQVCAFLTTIQLTENHDYYEWEIEGKINSNFCTGEVYTYLRGAIATHSWTKAIWYPHAIPRHSFHSWVVTLNIYPTKV